MRKKCDIVNIKKDAEIKQKRSTFTECGAKLLELNRTEPIEAESQVKSNKLNKRSEPSRAEPHRIQNNSYALGTPSWLERDKCSM